MPRKRVASDGANIKSVFAGRLTALMQAARENHRQLADALELSPSAIGFYVRAEGLPDVQTLMAIAAHYGCSIDFLLGLSDLQTTQADIQAACAVTGLSERAVNALAAADTIALEYLLSLGLFHEAIETIHLGLEQVDLIREKAARLESTQNPIEKERLKQQLFVDLIADNATQRTALADFTVAEYLLSSAFDGLKASALEPLDRLRAGAGLADAYKDLLGRQRRSQNGEPH